MRTTLHIAKSRGNQNHGWLQTYHSFSFADYYNPQRIHFGALRVLNDDFIEANHGFGMHPHDNMEIITIPFTGELTHSDSMGNTGIIKHGDIQVMSAGSGIMHSEFNYHKSESVTLFQIWIFSNKKNITPRYQQLSIAELAKPNEFFQILSPSKDDAGVWIYQNAWMHLGYFDTEHICKYKFHSQNQGAYIIVIEGSATIAGHTLEEKDAIGITDIQEFEIQTYKDSKILIIEVPMTL